MSAKAALMTSPYHPPVKRSLAIAGHKTSISLEPLFWDMLKSAAQREGLAVAALVARIDAERIKSPTPPGLASAIRVWLVVNAPEAMFHVKHADQARASGGQEGA